MISKTAIEVVTSPQNLSTPGDSDIGARAVRDGDVVAELRRLEGLGTAEARRLGREAVAHIGGHIEITRTGGLRPSRLTARRRETWWVPTTAVREQR